MQGFRDTKSKLHVADNMIVSPAEQSLIDAMWELLKYIGQVDELLHDVMSHNRLGDGS